MGADQLMLVTSPATLLRLKGFETGKGVPHGEPSLKAYLCPAGVWTIGWGATGKNIRQGTVWTRAECEVRFLADVQAVEADVRYLVTHRFNSTAEYAPLRLPPTTQNQFDALVLFAFNTGADIDKDSKAEGLGDSTLLGCHLRGDYKGAAHEFGRWVHGGTPPKTLPGLVARRAYESSLYQGIAR